ncbi:hypothetical protein V8C37DRAFT_372250 [Trichoderma ceciliae]
MELLLGLFHYFGTFIFLHSFFLSLFSLLDPPHLLPLSSFFFSPSGGGRTQLCALALPCAVIMSEDRWIGRLGSGRCGKWGTRTWIGLMGSSLGIWNRV